MKTRRRIVSRQPHLNHTPAITPYLHLALPLATARKCAQLTQHELAERAGVDHSFISRLENGSRDFRGVGLEVISRICWAVHLQVSELFPFLEFNEAHVAQPTDDQKPGGDQ